MIFIFWYVSLNYSKWNRFPENETFVILLLTLVSFQTCMTFFLLRNTGGDVSLKHGGGFCSNVEQYFHFWVNYSQQYLTLNKYVEIGVETHSADYLKWFIYICIILQYCTTILILIGQSQECVVRYFYVIATKLCNKWSIIQLNWS